MHLKKIDETGGPPSLSHACVLGGGAGCGERARRPVRGGYEWLSRRMRGTFPALTPRLHVASPEISAQDYESNYDGKIWRHARKIINKPELAQMW